MNTHIKQHMESRWIRLERKRLSHEIHDGIAQQVAVLHWQVNALSHRLVEMNVNLEETRQITRLVEKVHSDIRGFLRFLRGDDDTVRFKSQSEPTQLEPEHIVVKENLTDTKIPESHPEALIDAQLLSICREALANIRKHSGAHEINIKIQSTVDKLKLVITDNGCGIIVPTRHNGICNINYGLQIMRERAESIGGKFKVVSVNQKGTEINVEIPIPNKVMSSLL